MLIASHIKFLSIKHHLLLSLRLEFLGSGVGSPLANKVHFTSDLLLVANKDPVIVRFLLSDEVFELVVLRSDLKQNSEPKVSIEIKS